MVFRFLVSTLLISLVCAYNSVGSAAEERLSIAGMGDSLTENEGHTTWLTLLAELRSKEMYFGQKEHLPAPLKDVHAFNFARGGADSGDAVSYQLEGAASQEETDIVVILIGTNDFNYPVYSALYGGKDPKPNVDRLIANITKILDRLADS